MQNNEKRGIRLVATDYIAAFLGICAAALNIGFSSSLPEQMVTGIGFSGEAVTTERLMFIIIASCIVVVSALMSIFTSRKTKWFVIASVTFVLNIVCLLINLL